jgi:RNA-dependent RNA polymerase
MGDEEDRYEFLAYSSSQLRDHCCWFFLSTKHASVRSVKKWMGDFRKEKCVAKCGARQGQCFSTTISTGKVDIDDIKKIPDIWDDNHKYCFSDGIGQISHSFAIFNSRQMGKLVGHYAAFQIRIAGFKGVVLYNRYLGDELHESDGELVPYKLALRPSMDKFSSIHYHFEVVTASRYIPFYFNRQIILLLSCLGIGDEVFVNLQDEMIAALECLTTDVQQAVALLQYSNTSIHKMLIALLEAGFPLNEPYPF